MKILTIRWHPVFICLADYESLFVVGSQIIFRSNMALYNKNLLRFLK